VYEFGGGEVRECLGGIYEFLEKKRMASLRELESAPRSRTEKDSPVQAKENGPAAKNEPERKLSYAEQRERDKAIKRAARKVEEAEAEVGRREAAVAEIEARIAAGDVAPEVFTLHSEATKALENAMSMWELAVMEAEEAGLKS
ncbi:MAG: ABC transporter ATP-binding protein, partial [Muribaculaceae bacterium]|nr:ABC transporter ATP-binding protein [Muribaculaceae bacterium]